MITHARRRAAAKAVIEKAFENEMLMDEVPSDADRIWLSRLVRILRSGSWERLLDALGECQETMPRMVASAGALEGLGQLIADAPDDTILAGGAFAAARTHDHSLPGSPLANFYGRLAAHAVDLGSDQVQYLYRFAIQYEHRFVADALLARDFLPSQQTLDRAEAEATARAMIPLGKREQREVARIRAITETRLLERSMKAARPQHSAKDGLSAGL